MARRHANLWFIEEVGDAFVNDKFGIDSAGRAD
jgi:hypothetical protein